MWRRGDDPARSDVAGAPKRSVHAQQDDDQVVVAAKDFWRGRFISTTIRSFSLFVAASILTLLMSWVMIYWALDIVMPTVHLASLSFTPFSKMTTITASLSPSPSHYDGYANISGNWSISFTAKSRNWREHLTWDHPRVMLFYGNEFIAGTFLNRVSSVPPKHSFTLESEVVAFSRELKDPTAQKLMGLKTNGGRDDDGLSGFQVIMRPKLYSLPYYCHALSGSPCNCYLCLDQ